ncbi:ATP-binding protein [Paludibaculum fermentans]|uniref:ATP-binding protein n=1 Tax=Paludibaculum fermentans TaxID=1473598 RepID=UPI003EBF0E1C
MLPDYEKLGAFYLGRLKDTDQTLLYDSKDLTTHAVCVGMTGSGKTGLCLGLLEEAAIDGIPALVIDPKGDLANLLLTFPNLAAQDFEPWVNPDEARNKGLDVPAFAAAEAAKWSKGLAQWGQDGARIERLREACDFAVYTPGSDAGIPVSILKSFDAPSQAILDDREALRDRVSSTATSLLALAGIDADPVQSREHILLSTILDTAWRAGTSLDLAAIIGQIQKPPFQRVGVLDLDSFYPAKERFGLAMALNNLLASPGFEAWLSGDPLDIDAMLWTPKGKPRISIFSIAHLSDTERMFFVSLLLNQTLSWVRSQSGTSSLRALLYMDEIFGYFPPIANPPSKKPLLTLLKQARAFGLGVVLATQNPVDLDYKGLGNTGTWFIGRLQTERDKARVLEGLEGAAASAGAKFDRGEMEQILAGLGNRVFLMNNVHEDAPVLFQTRWTLSYLRGPLARPEIKRLMQGALRAEAAVADDAAVAAAPGESSTVPVLPPDVSQLFVPLKGSVLCYEPRILGAARVQFADAKLGVDEVRDCLYACPITEEAIPVDWPQAEALDVPLNDLEKTPTDGASFAELPAIAARGKNYAIWQKSFATWLFQNQSLELLRSPSTGEVSRIGEAERDFRLRIQQSAREARDEQVQDLRARYAPKLQTLNDRLQRAQLKLEQEKAQATSQTLSSVLSIGTSILGAFMGRKTISTANINRIGTAARAATKIGKERGDVGLANDTVENVQVQMQELNQQLADEIATIPEVGNEEFGTITVKPKKTGIQVQLVSLIWM